jgi:hypothetical protein
VTIFLENLAETGWTFRLLIHAVIIFCYAVYIESYF